MSSLQQRLVAVSDMRLAAIAAAAANLKIQLSELERLREQVRKTLEIAELENLGDGVQSGQLRRSRAVIHRASITHSAARQ